MISAEGIPGAAATFTPGCLEEYVLLRTSDRPPYALPSCPQRIDGPALAGQLADRSGSSSSAEQVLRSSRNSRHSDNLIRDLQPARPHLPRPSRSRDALDTASVTVSPMRHALARRDEIEVADPTSVVRARLILDVDLMHPPQSSRVHDSSMNCRYRRAPAVLAFVGGRGLVSR